MSDSPVVDLAAIERLKKWGGNDLPQKMVGIFLDHTMDRLDQIRTGLAEEDQEAAATGAHSLKSSAGNVGAVRLQEICQEAERLAEGRDFSALGGVLPDLEARGKRGALFGRGSARIPSLLQPTVLDKLLSYLVEGPSWICGVFPPNYNRSGGGHDHYHGGDARDEGQMLSLIHI